MTTNFIDFVLYPTEEKLEQIEDKNTALRLLDDVPQKAQHLYFKYCRGDRNVTVEQIVESMYKSGDKEHLYTLIDSVILKNKALKEIHFMAEDDDKAPLTIKYDEYGRIIHRVAHSAAKHNDIELFSYLVKNGLDCLTDIAMHYIHKGNSDFAKKMVAKGFVSWDGIESHATDQNFHHVAREVRSLRE